MPASRTHGWISCCEAYYYNAAKVMRSTIAVCVEAGGLAVRTTDGSSTTMFLSRRYIKGDPTVTHPEIST